MKLLAEEVYVVSGNLLCALPSHTDPVVLEDIIHSNLLCQLVADKSLGTRFANPAAWLEAYRNSLGKVFWRISNSGTISYPLPPLTHSITVKEVLEQTFYKALDRSVRVRLEESIEQWGEQPADSPPALLFNVKTHVNGKQPTSATSSLPKPLSTVNLQVSVVHDGAHISVCSVYFTTSTAVGDDVFNQVFPAKALIGNISVSAFEAKLLESNYALIRQSIIEKLGEDNIRENILLVPADVPDLPNPRHARAQQFIQELEV